MIDIDKLVSREVYEKLMEYMNLVLKWNNHMNLVSYDDTDVFVRRHILDSLQLLRFLDDKDVSVVDIGSGAGLPGVVLSIAGVSNVTLIESDVRKSAFLGQASRISNSKIRIINDRLENLDNLSCDVITSRAFGNLGKILDLTSRIKVDGKYLLHKGKTYLKEIESVKKDWLFNVKVHDSITSDYGKILEITNPIKLL